MTNHKQGMFLSNNGIIGQQGNAGFSTANQWLGINWTSTNYNTFTDNLSTAANSKLYVKGTGAYFPGNNNGAVFVTSYGNPSPQYLFIVNPNASVPLACSNFTTGGGGCQTCLVAQNALLNNIATDNVTYSVTINETKEINKNMLYKAIDQSPSLSANSATLVNFYSTNASQNRGILNNVEKQLGSGNISQASSLLNSITIATNIENNYKTFFNLYISYKTNGGLTAAENNSLAVLAYQCPYIDGSVVFQARALYSVFNQKVITYNDANCYAIGYSLRENANNGSQQDELDVLLVQNERVSKQLFGTITSYVLFPNPAQDEVNVGSTNNSEKLLMRICDVNGKLLMEKSLTIENFNSNVKIDLQNGIYFVSLVNQNNESFVRKLVISK